MDLEKLTTSSRNLESQIRLLTFWVTQNREPHPAATRTSRQGTNAVVLLPVRSVHERGD